MRLFGKLFGFFQEKTEDKENARERKYPGWETVDLTDGELPPEEKNEAEADVCVKNSESEPLGESPEASEPFIPVSQVEACTDKAPEYFSVSDAEREDASESLFNMENLSAAEAADFEGVLSNALSHVVKTAPSESDTGDEQEICEKTAPPSVAEAPESQKEKSSREKYEIPPFKQKRVAVSMLKGGVGKTTAVCFIASALQRIWDDNKTGDRLLVVDGDPQGSATDFFLSGDVEPDKSFCALLQEEPMTANFKSIIYPTRYPRIDILAAHPDAADVAVYQDDRREDRLARFIEDTGDEYSMILMDTPPSLTLALKNVLIAASDVYAPVDPSRQGLKTLPNFVNRLSLYHSPHNGIRLGGVLLSRYNGNRIISKKTHGLLARLLPDEIPLFCIPDRTAIAKCYNKGDGVEGLCNESGGADCRSVFMKLARHILEH